MATENTHIMQAAKLFATKLNRRDYGALPQLLADNCAYEFWGDVVRGAKRIVEEYRTNTEWAFDVFDRIEFTSAVAPESSSLARSSRMRSPPDSEPTLWPCWSARNRKRLRKLATWTE